MRNEECERRNVSIAPPRNHGWILILFLFLIPHFFDSSLVVQTWRLGLALRWSSLNLAETTPADARFLHRTPSMESPSLRPLVVGDDDELRPPCELLQEVRKPPTLTSSSGASISSSPQKGLA
jgi:hypothetical protein